MLCNCLAGFLQQVIINIKWLERIWLISSQFFVITYYQCLLQTLLIITVVKLGYNVHHRGPSLFVRYSREFVITVIVITKFDWKSKNYIVLNLKLDECQKVLIWQINKIFTNLARLGSNSRRSARSSVSRPSSCSRSTPLTQPLPERPGHVVPTHIDDDDTYMMAQFLFVW